MAWFQKALNRWYRIFHIAIVAAFFAGFFLDIRWLAIGGGIGMVIEDVLEIYDGELKPYFPILLALILAWFIDPWYMGVFWASSAFHILNIPGDLMVFFASNKKMEEAKRMKEIMITEKFKDKD